MATKHGRHLKPDKHERAYRRERAATLAAEYYAGIERANKRHDEQARRANWTGPDLNDGDRRDDEGTYVGNM